MANGSLLNSQIGEYRLIDFLGAGGMGEVYRAVHSKIGRVVAVKILTQTAGNSNQVERFLNEARIQATLQHPNIATLYDFLEFGGRPCIIMEFVDGQTLDERIRALGALPLAEVVFIFLALVEAVSYIHANNIIHRDIKSNNVKVSSAGQVKLLDFGIAKAGETPNFTVTGNVVGTLQYLSPEQLKGGIADTRSDVWAMGVLLYEMATGRMPFDASTVGTLYEKVMKADYPAARSINPATPPDVEAIIGRCLRKDASDRYQSALAIRDQAIGLSRLVSAPRLSDEHYSGKDQRSVIAKAGGSRSLLFMGAGAAVILVLLGLYALFGWLLAPGPSTDTGGSGGAAAGTPSPAIIVGEPAGRAEVGPANGRGSGLATATGQETLLHIDVNEGHAQVYVNQQYVGTTPLAYPAKTGETLKVVLKQPGFEDKVVPPITVEQNAVPPPYTFTMTKQQ